MPSAVCLTEQPLSDVLITRGVIGSRYSGYGIAFHKYALHQAGGQPVIYGPKSIIGRKLRSDEPGYEAGKDIYTGGLPADLQYLWVQYKPTIDDDSYPIDFTWEREWRVRCPNSGLPVYLDTFAGQFKPDVPVGAIIVERDEDVEVVKGTLFSLEFFDGKPWAGNLKRIISLETAARKLADGDTRYARIETWPVDEEPSPTVTLKPPSDQETETTDLFGDLFKL